MMKGAMMRHMNTLAIDMKANSKKRTLRVEIDAARLERLAAGLGLFNPDFLDSVARAEKDLRGGRVRKVKSLADIR